MFYIIGLVHPATDVLHQMFYIIGLLMVSKPLFQLILQQVLYHSEITPFSSPHLQEGQPIVVHQRHTKQWFALKQHRQQMLQILL